MFLNLKDQILWTMFKIIFKISRKISYIIKYNNLFITFNKAS